MRRVAVRRAPASAIDPAAAPRRDRDDLPTPTGAAEFGDLSGRTAIHDLVVEFYREIVFDDLLGPVFTEVAEVDWSLHIPRLVDYWCRILLGDAGYVGRPMEVHRRLHAAEPLRTEHCDRWYWLWADCVDRRAAGPRAERAKAHAAHLMAGMATRVFGFDWAPPA